MSDDIQPDLDFNRGFDPGSNEPRRQRHLLKVVLITATFILIAVVITIAATRASRYNAKVASSRNSAQSGKILTSPAIISPAPVHATSSSAILPSADLFNKIVATSTSTLRLIGVARNTANTASPVCVVSTVNTDTFTISKPTPINCTDPAAYGRQVGIATQYFRGGKTGLEATVEIAKVSTTGQVAKGPALMTYTSCSDCGPVSAYGDGILWIYDNSTTSGAELVEVSDTTGKLIATVPMPKLFRPLLAANNQGLFIANSLYGARAPGEAPPSALYQLSPGSTTATVKIANPSLLACWLTTDPNHLWIGMGTQHDGCRQETIWRDAGTNPKQLSPIHLYLPQPVGNQSSGLWTVTWSSSKKIANSALVTVTPQLLHIDPNNGKVTFRAVLSPIQVNEYLSSMPNDSELVQNRFLYLLDSPKGKENNYSAIIRVDIAQK